MVPCFDFDMPMCFIIYRVLYQAGGSVAFFSIVLIPLMGWNIHRVAVVSMNLVLFSLEVSHVTDIVGALLVE